MFDLTSAFDASTGKIPNIDHVCAEITHDRSPGDLSGPRRRRADDRILGAERWTGPSHGDLRDGHQ